MELLFNFILQIVRVILKKTEMIKETLKEKDFKKFMQGTYNFHKLTKLKK